MALDQNIVTALPDGSRPISVDRYGHSERAVTSKITTTTCDERQQCFFLKTIKTKVGSTIFLGEFESMNAICKAAPGFAPRPIAWGQCCGDEETFFFISEFIRIKPHGNLPDTTPFCKALAQLHHNSASPTGKFGFHVTTCNGDVPQNNQWESSWEVFFSKGLRHMLEIDRKANGICSELEQAMEPIFENVIPRLLRQLQQGANPIRPVLLHGDLWYGNCSARHEDGRPIIFDASAFYGHNEYELGNWRPARNLLGGEYVAAYKRFWAELNPLDNETASKRDAEFEDRIMLYELRFNFHYCIMVPGLQDVKKEMVANMKYLAAKYTSADQSE
ncbi:hypothetical protein LMH87_009921 [Akanthomyces muscarius]|uniref:protein-ribulosamine 3-kinase n=1 Tax=Akanthomyces muscarius TaxID=2231603 RepID=A0A9W8QCT3_AKAMU|nr:hypothetical protein LMH87_009921 [Akanthomyces muscarius]KAJ4153436.1 hypothetical protein LMH87_009921 [Akanthomyces muscarius]